MILQFDSISKRILYPFKLNHVWLDQIDFGKLVRYLWSFVKYEDLDSPMLKLVKKLKSLKSIVIMWERNRKRDLIKELKQSL